ncbi:MAG: uridine kinase [Gemmataceae bacterium]
MKTPFVIGIAGGSGSGKTTLVSHLTSRLGPKEVAVLHHDAYYHTRDNMPESVRSTNNWDHPDALDNQFFVEHLGALTAGKPIERPVYDFATHTRTDNTVSVKATAVLIVEGILLLAIPEIREHIDLRVFVDTPGDIRFVRRLRRDIQERGRTHAEVCHQYEATVRPMHEAHVEPSRHHAHVIVPLLRENEPAVEVLTARIRVALGES